VSTEHVITVVAEADLEELLPLLRGYCDFYEVAPSDEALIALAPSGRAVGFATVYWTWQTLAASRLGVMNDLFVAEEARGSGLAERLIAASRERCAEHGARSLGWQTAKDNHRAQKVYERVGGRRSEWLDYSLTVQ
jgi:GNAT superfamily N-acetyltransferase